MAYNWKILRAAVEQEILFSNREAFDSYIKALTEKEFPFEVVRSTDNDDGTVTVLMRKRYNPQNQFLSKEK